MAKKKLIRITTVPVSLGGLLNGQHKFMSNYFNVIGISSQGKNNELDVVSQEESIPTISVEMTRKITPIKDTIALFKLFSVFKKEKPFIVHSHTPKAGTLAMVAAKMAGVPNRLHTIAGLPLVEVFGIKRVLLNLVERFTYGCATMIYPNSYGLVNIILENKFTNKNKIKVIANGSSNGIDTNHFDPKLYSTSVKELTRTELGIKSEDYVYVFVGRLVGDKGVNELVSAFDKLCRNNSNIKLLLVGGYEKELDPLAQQTLNIIKKNKSILATGWVNDVRPYLIISDTLVFPSYREGFPNVVMQAGAMGLPSIVTDINGCNEIIIDGKNGTIIPVKNTEILFEKMNKFLDKEIEFNSEKCRELIVTRYQRQVVWDALLKEYKSL